MEEWGFQTARMNLLAAHMVQGDSSQLLTLKCPPCLVCENAKSCLEFTYGLSPIRYAGCCECFEKNLSEENFLQLKHKVTAAWWGVSEKQFFEIFYVLLDVDEILTSGKYDTCPEFETFLEELSFSKTMTIKPAKI